MKLFYRKKLSLVSIITVENEKTFEQLTIATPMRKNKLNIRISPNELQGLFADSHTKSCVSITYTIFRKPILLYHKADMMKRCRYDPMHAAASLSPHSKDCSPDWLGLEYWLQRTAVPAGQDWQDNRTCWVLQLNAFADLITEPNATPCAPCLL